MFVQHDHELYIVFQGIYMLIITTINDLLSLIRGLWFHYDQYIEMINEEMISEEMIDGLMDRIDKHSETSSVKCIA